jgi:NDP-sugar pyrophosphorylase family protein
VSQRKTKRYLLFADDMHLKGWTNIETGQVRSPYSSLREDSSLFTLNSSLQKLAFSGIHVIWPSVFPLFSEMPERFGIIDFYLKYCHQFAFVGHEQKDLQLMDVGKLDTLHDAEQFLNNLENKR